MSHCSSAMLTPCFCVFDTQVAVWLFSSLPYGQGSWGHPVSQWQVRGWMQISWVSAMWCTSPRNSACLKNMSVTYSLSWYKTTTPTQGQAEQRTHIAKQLFSRGDLQNVENTVFFQKREKSGLGAFCDIDSTQLPATLGGEKTYCQLLI